MKINYTRLSEAGLFYAALIWGATFFIVKDIITELNPITLLTYRFLLAAFFIFLVYIKNTRSLFKNFRYGLVVGILLWIIYTPQTIGLKFTTASNSGFITGLFVLFLPLFSYIFSKKTPTLFESFSIALSITGLWLLTGGINNINTGDLLTLITAIGCAAHIYVVDRFVNNNKDPIILCFQQFLVVGMISLIINIIFNISLSLISHRILLTTVFLALFPTFSAFLIQLKVQQFVNPLKVSLIFSLEPVFGGVFAWTLGNEAFVFIKAIGGFLIFLAIVIYSLNLSGFHIQNILKRTRLP